MKRPDPLRPLLYALRSPSPADRTAATLALNRRSTERLPIAERRLLTRGLLDALRDGDPRVRRLAEIGLEHGDFSEADRRALIRAPRTAEACRLLGKWTDVLPSLRRALRDKSPQVRDAARRTLAEAEGVWVPCAPRHETPIEAIDISPDGRLLASGCQGSVVVIWDTRTGRPKCSLRRLSPDLTGISGVSFGQDASRLAVGDIQGLTLLDPVSGEVRLTQDHDDAERIFGNRPLGLRHSDTSSLRFIDSKGKRRNTLRLAAAPDAIAVSADLSAVAVRSDVLSILDGTNGSVRCVVPRGEFGPSELVALSPDGSKVATTDGYGQSIELWDARTGQAVAAWRASNPPIFRGVLEFSPDGGRLAFGSSVLDVASGTWLWRETSTTWVRAARFTPDGAFLATAGDDHVVTLWDAATGRKERTFGAPRNEVSVIRVAGTRMAVGYEDGRVDLREGSRVETLQAGFRVRSLSFSPDRRRLVCAGEASYAKLFDSDGVRELRPWDGRVASVAWSPTSQQVALGGRFQETAHLALYDVDHAWSKPLRMPHGRTFKNVADLVFSPGGKHLAGILDGHPVLWDVEEGGPLLLPQVDWTCGLAFSPDGRLLAGGTTGHEIVLWDVENIRIHDIWLARRDSPSEFAFSPDGRRLAFTTSYDSAVEVRDVTTGARLRVLRGHVGSGRAVAWGHRLVTGAADGRLIFWPRV